MAQLGVPMPLTESRALSAFHSFMTGEIPYQNWRGVYEPSTSRAEKLSDAAPGWISVAYFLTVAESNYPLDFTKRSSGVAF